MGLAVDELEAGRSQLGIEGTPNSYRDRWVVTIAMYRAETE